MSDELKKRNLQRAAFVIVVMLMVFGVIHYFTLKEKSERRAALLNAESFISGNGSVQRRYRVRILDPINCEVEVLVARTVKVKLDGEYFRVEKDDQLIKSSAILGKEEAVEKFCSRLLSELTKTERNSYSLWLGDDNMSLIDTNDNSLIYCIPIDRDSATCKHKDDVIQAKKLPNGCVSFQESSKAELTIEELVCPKSVQIPESTPIYVAKGKIPLDDSKDVQILVEFFEGSLK